MAGISCNSECGLAERWTSGHEMEANTMEEGEINDVAGEEVAMEDMDDVKVMNKVNNQRRGLRLENGTR
jgi:hypothetical protein